MTARSPYYQAPRLPLERVEVRPIRPAERARWQALLDRHHYLGAPALVGKRARYIAHLDGHWLALIAWQSAALKCRARDRWIGWSAVLQYQRLHLIANNSRFLILPEARSPNLASRVLALNLQRLSADWQRIHGHLLLLAETFIDIGRFHGGCYRAANWRFVGLTRGFARKPGGGYTHHGQPKAVAVYPLERNARAWLASPSAHRLWSASMQNVTLSNAQMEDLHQRLRALPDHRKPRGVRHRAATVFTIAIAAALAGQRSYAAMAEWAQRLTQAQLKRLRARFDPRTRRFLAPSEPTLRRMLTDADAPVVEETLSQWLLGLSQTDESIAVDGKTLRGAVRPDGSQVHLLSALLPELGVSIAQREVAAKTNEIPELPRLLEPLEITGRVISADALHTQRETARYLVEDKHAHYLFTVKDNQPSLYRALGDLEWSLFPPERRER